jgi:archaellum component FlaC
MDRNDADHKEQTDGLRLKYEKEIEELKKQIEFLQKEIDELSNCLIVLFILVIRTFIWKFFCSRSDFDSTSTTICEYFSFTVWSSSFVSFNSLIKKSQFDDIEASYKRLQEENLTLRTRGGAKKVPKQIDKQIEFLERKQKDAETRVKLASLE